MSFEREEKEKEEKRKADLRVVISWITIQFLSCIQKFESNDISFCISLRVIFSMSAVRDRKIRGEGR